MSFGELRKNVMPETLILLKTRSMLLSDVVKQSAFLPVMVVAL